MIKINIIKNDLDNFSSIQDTILILYFVHEKHTLHNPDNPLEYLPNDLTLWTIPHSLTTLNANLCICRIEQQYSLDASTTFLSHIDAHYCSVFHWDGDDIRGTLRTRRLPAEWREWDSTSTAMYRYPGDFDCVNSEINIEILIFLYWLQISIIDV